MTDKPVPAIIDDPIDFTVVATNPADMQAAQRQMIAWAERKILAIRNDMAEALEQLALFKKRKWSPAGWQREVAKKQTRVDFYTKIKLALEAGYYIVPPFPIDLFAIRTKRHRPERRDSSYSDNHDQAAQILPAGEGRYVDPKPERQDCLVNEQRGDKTVRVQKWWASDYHDVGFPFRLARAEIREATDKAMSLKIFDQFGVLPRVRKPDPIICGQILVPNKPAYMRFSSERDAVTFFVAWWLDTRTL